MKLKDCVLSCLKTLNGLIDRPLCDLSDVTYLPSDFKTNNEPPCDGWLAYDPKNTFLESEMHYWFRTSFRTPSLSENEYLVLRIQTGGPARWFHSKHQGLIYLNGKMTQGWDENHTDTYLEPNTDYTVHDYLYTGNAPGTYVPHQMTLVAIHKDVEQLYYDIKVPFDACQLMSDDSADYISIMSVLTDAVRLVDFRAPRSEAFFASVKEAINYMEEEFYAKRCSPCGKPVVHCIGHTHIDVEWLWDRAQTKEKMQRSFSTAKALMDRYPEYNFMLSQPELYRYLKEEAPEKYEELKELVAQGRWEPEGAMYLESDCNLTSGESLVRQILFGKRFFREEFGKDCKILFLPDVFGYSAALPQILRKSGVEYFVTSKISWNDVNTMPNDMFYWVGIDGTPLFTSFMTSQDFVNGKGPNFTTYNAKINASFVKGTWNRFHQKEYTNHVFMTFGYGDGGGGPTREMLEMQRRTARGIPSLPVTVTDTLTNYLQTAKEEFDKTCRRTGRTPKWVGELYLEYHRGTYTSIGKIKKDNRNAEFLLGNAEVLSVTDLALGGSYDVDGLRQTWQKVLHNQFHDILPGSSVKSVYDGTDRDYAQITAYGEGVVEEKLNALANRIKTEGGVLLYNPTGFDRPAVLTENGYTDTNHTVPAFGWTVIRNAQVNAKVRVDGMTAENDFYTVTLNQAGQITSLFDKTAQRDVLIGCGNVLICYDDHPNQYDAWEVEDHYRLKPYVLDTDATVTPVTDGTRAGWRVERSYMNSTICQNIWLYSESRRIDFETEVDWHEHQQLLKAVFHPDVHTDRATFDVQFGHVTRPTHENTGWDAAKFETYAHKWVDLSENGYGVSLLNNGKYGHSVLDGDLAITLLKCATFPNPEADQGKQSFTYSLLPHTDDFRRGGVIEESYVINQPLYQKALCAQEGTIPETASFVRTSTPSAVITAVKKAEQDDGLVVRFYDAYDCRSSVTLTVPTTYRRAYLCDLMENHIRELTVTEGSVTLPVSNFEIITVKFM